MGEYIEREAAKRALADSDVVPKYKADNRPVTDEIIDDIPAADVAPVVHGRWDGDTCTACKLPWKYNMVQDADDWGYFDPMPDYCPNCGAKMDGGAENGRRRGNAHAQD